MALTSPSSQPPPSPGSGDVWIDGSGRRLVWATNSMGDGAWVQVRSSRSSAVPRDTMTDEEGRRFMWTVDSTGQGVWVQVPPIDTKPQPSPLVATVVPLSPVVSKIPVVTASTYPPGNAQPNDLWYDSGSGFFFIYFNDGNTVQWVVTNPGRGGDTGPPGIPGPVGPQGPQGIQGPAGGSVTITEGTGIDVTGGPDYTVSVQPGVYQPIDPGLTVLASAAPGIIANTGSDTFASRIITGTANRVAITNGGGVLGNPTVNIDVAYDGLWQPIDGDLTALAALSTTGMMARSAINTYTMRTITGTANRVTVANGDGVSGNPTIDISATLTASFQPADPGLTVLASIGTGIVTNTAADTFVGRTLTGTAARIAVTNGNGVLGPPTIDIDATYVGQNSITSLGTITSGVWNSTLITGQYGGTGVANTGKTITLGGSLMTSGAFASTFTMTGTTSVVFPVSGTLATLTNLSSYLPLTGGTLTSPGNLTLPGAFTITPGGTSSVPTMPSTDDSGSIATTSWVRDLFATRGQGAAIYVYSGTTSTTNPGVGNFTIQVNAGVDRLFAINKTDADAVSRFLMLFLPGDALIITNEFTPVTYYARYEITGNPVDNGTWIQIDSNFTDSKGVIPPPIGTRIKLTGFLNSATGTGPIIGVAAGYGLTGGGTSGNVTLAVNPATIAPLASPSFTGTPVAVYPTGGLGSNDTTLPNTKWVKDQGYATTAALTAGYQPLDSDLTALAALATTGVMARSGTNIYSLRTNTGTLNRLVVTNGDGVAGNPTFNIDPTYDGLWQPKNAGLTGLSSILTGIVANTAANTFVPRTITGTASRVVITNGDGVAGNPTIDLSATYDARWQPIDPGLTALASVATGMIANTAADTFAARTITGTASRLAVTNGSGVAGNPTLDIDAAYVGQASITTLGTVATGVWNASLIAGQYGGTGVNNAGKTITLGGNLTTSGAFASTFTMTGITTVTFPTSGTLATTAQLNAGTVTTVSVVSANGLAGTVATATSTPAITLSTTITGMLKGNATAISAAVANTDYLPVAGPSYTGILTGTTASAFIGGVGQTVANFDPAGALGGSVTVHDTGSAVGTGGAVIFSDSFGKFAAIKGYAQSGTGPVGALSVSLRKLGADTTFTEAARFQSDGSLTVTGPVTSVTAAPGTNTTQLASTAFVTAAVAASPAYANVGVTPPSTPANGQLWFNSDGSAGGGKLYVYYNDGNTTQWVPVA